MFSFVLITPMLEAKPVSGIKLERNSDRRKACDSVGVMILVKFCGFKWM